MSCFPKAPSPPYPNRSRSLVKYRFEKSRNAFSFVSEYAANVTSRTVRGDPLVDFIITKHDRLHHTDVPTTIPNALNSLYIKDVPVRLIYYIV